MLRDYLELARISNAPTVVTNVMTGVVLGTAAGWTPDGATAVTLAVIVLAIYVAGMILNDVFDAEIDRVERPERPIPSGRVPREQAAIVGLVLLVGGTGAMAFYGWRAAAVAGLLSLCVLAYDALHKRTPASVILMGLCRALIYPLAAFAVGWNGAPIDLVTLATVLFLYIVAVTVVARVEAAPDAGSRGRLAWLLPVIGLAAAIVVRPSDPTWAGAAAGAFVTWIVWISRFVRRRPPVVGAAVGGWLAAICLLDAWFLALLEQPAWAAIAVAAFVLTRFGHRMIAGS